MSVGLEQVTKCERTGCHAETFLPIQCEYCHHFFCEEHGVRHQCSQRPSSGNRTPLHTPPIRSRQSSITGMIACAVCQTPCLPEFTVACSRCGRRLCMTDRLRCACRDATDGKRFLRRTTGGLPFVCLQVFDFITSFLRLLLSVLRALMKRVAEARGRSHSRDAESSAVQEGNDGSAGGGNHAHTLSHSFAAEEASPRAIGSVTTALLMITIVGVYLWLAIKYGPAGELILQKRRRSAASSVL